MLCNNEGAPAGKCMTACVNNGTGAGASPAARVASPTDPVSGKSSSSSNSGSRAISGGGSSGGEASGGIGFGVDGAQPHTGLSERFFVAMNGGGPPRVATAPATHTLVAAASIAKTEAPVTMPRVSGGSSGGGISSTGGSSSSSSRNGGRNGEFSGDTSGGVSRCAGPLVASADKPNCNSIGGDKGGSSADQATGGCGVQSVCTSIALVARNDHSREGQAAVNLHEGLDRQEQGPLTPPLSHPISSLATREESPERHAPPPRPPAPLPRPAAALQSTAVPKSYPPNATSLAVLPPSDINPTVVVGQDGGRPELEAAVSPPVPAASAPASQKSPPPPPATSLQLPSATSLKPKPAPSLSLLRIASPPNPHPHPTCSGRERSQPKVVSVAFKPAGRLPLALAAETAKPALPPQHDSTSPGVAARSSSTSSLFSHSTPLSTPPVASSGDGGGPQAARKSGTQPDSSSPWPTASKIPPLREPVSAPAAAPVAATESPSAPPAQQVLAPTTSAETPPVPVATHTSGKESRTVSGSMAVDALEVESETGDCAPAVAAVAPSAPPFPAALAPVFTTAETAALPVAKRPRGERRRDESQRTTVDVMEGESETGDCSASTGISSTHRADEASTGAAEASADAGIGEREDEGGTGGVDAAGKAESRIRTSVDANSSREKGSKRVRVEIGAVPGEVIMPVGAPVIAPFLELPEVSRADVGKLVVSETSDGTLTGVVESFSQTEDDLGVWSIRYENGDLRETDDCGELHDDMCGYYELACNAAAAPGEQVRTCPSPSVQERVRVAVLKEDGDGESSAIGRRVSVVRDKVLHVGQVTEYVQPTRDGEIEQWRVTFANGEHEDMDSFELVQPFLRHVQQRIEQRAVEWGHRKLVVYMHRAGGVCRPFLTLSGISASVPKVQKRGRREEQDI